MPKPELKTVAPGEEKDKAQSPSPEEMKALLQADRQARANRAAERVKQVLEEERCVMNPVMVITAQGNKASVEITALD